METGIARYNRNDQKDLLNWNRKIGIVRPKRWKDGKISGVKGRLLGRTNDFVLETVMYCSDSCSSCKLISH